MIWLSPSETTADVWDAVLAIDTTLTPHGEGGTLPESAVPGEFRIEPVRLGVFWNDRSIIDWVELHYQRRLRQLKTSPPEKDPKEWRGALQAHLAGLYLFLGERRHFPKFTLSRSWCRLRLT